MSRALAKRLKLQLEEMRLHDGTGDPFDDGYQEAIGEMEAWLFDQSEMREEEEERA